MLEDLHGGHGMPGPEKWLLGLAFEVRLLGLAFLESSSKGLGPLGFRV